MTVTETMTPPPGFIEEIEALGLFAGWKKREPQMWPTPKRTYVSAIWRAREARDVLDRSTNFVSPKFAERRHVILANPIAGNSYATCTSMVTAYQLVLGGETARSHRHTPNALRIVLDAEGGMVTLVNGLAVDMAPGDIVLTPQWHWHGHANESDAPAFWIDVLDVPLVQRLENIFFEHHPETLETPTGVAPDSPLRIRGDAALAAVGGQGSLAVGDGQLPTISLELTGYAGADHVSVAPAIDNRIFTVLDGSVALSTERLGDVILERGDVAVVPSWTPYSVGAAGSGTLLQVSDAPVFAALGFRDPASIRF